ncbi:chaperonin 10-like protein [Boletus edulis BED1]|uniref:Chaperonin 10-like protein n=1 Tax=Boletus edulis BED1 TaxID=1328754 RepID=A0AAD4GEX1_BOLED|nr:chaperonin 10-like protein [Boletus edulis BED1]
MSSHKQKALFLEAKNGQFVVGEHDIPKPGSGQVLVKIHTAALNPVDYKIQQTGALIEKFPAVLGVDMAGVVEDVGEGVQDYVKGNKVFAHGNFTDDQASYQQYAVATTDFTAKIPPNLDFDRAATVPLGFDTASVGLYSDQLGAGLTPPWVEGGRDKYAGKSILIMGGSSSVGSYVIQLAKLSGFSHIITTANPAHQDELKLLGATEVIDRHLSGEKFTAALQKITQQPIKIAYDAIALPETQRAAMSAVAQGGKLVMTLQPAVKEEEGKGRSVTATFGHPYAEPNKIMCSQSWKVLGKWLQDGLIKPNNFEVLPNGLFAIPGGLQRMKDGKISGKKLVVHPQETA